MNTIAIIPARMASTRFPGKPLARIDGIPMIAHVYFRTALAELTQTCVATCDDDILAYVQSLGAVGVMTADTHEACTDRTSEALAKMEEQFGTRYDVVVMVQGDEPMVTPAMIAAVIAPLRNEASLRVVNLMGVMRSAGEHADPNQVKVVTDLNSNAIYMSREPIPSRKKYSGDLVGYRQFGIIAFRREFLLSFNAMARSPLEVIESVDMLRVIENRIELRMVLADTFATTVDTPSDLAAVEQLMRGDSLTERYRARCPDIQEPSGGRPR